MKKLLVILTIFLVKTNLSAQVNVVSPTDGSLTIFPKGIIDSRTYDPSKNFKFIALGDSVFKSNTTGGDGVVAIGNKAMAKSQNVGYSVAIGEKSMYNATTGYANVAVGSQTLMNNTGYGNTAVGEGVLTKSTSGVSNTGLGWGALSSNINGSRNVAIGINTLANAKSTTDNIAIGTNALNAINHENLSYTRQTNMISIGSYSSQNLQVEPGASGFDIGNIIIGNYSFYNAVYGRGNVTLGHNTLYYASNTNSNTALGNNSLHKLNVGSMVNYNGNTATGDHSLSELILGSNNTAAGIASGNSLINGENNTFMGISSGVIDIPSGEFINNSMALGATAKVNASNKVVIGNASVSQIGGYASWVNYSDRRLKENIVYNNNLGLSFINALKTASYTYRADINKRRRDGLIAQDVQEVLENQGVEFSGLIQDNDSNKTLNLSYTELVIPLINAVKELSNQNNNLKAEMNAMQKDMETLKSLIQAKIDVKSPTDK